MLRYFIAGNVWALGAVVLVPGREPWRAGPAQYEFFGQRSFSPASYNFLVAFCVIAAPVFLLLAWKTHEKKHS